MLNKEQVSKIFYNNPNKLKWQLSTIIYSFSIRDIDHSIVFPVQDTTQESKPLDVIIWVIFNRLIIAHELWTGRKQVFNLMFCDHSLGFNVGELKRIIRKPSNRWLGIHPCKVEQFEDYCMSFFNDDAFWDDVCEYGNITTKKYKQILSNASRVFDAVIVECQDFEKKRRELERVQKRSMRECSLFNGEVEQHTKLYSQNFEDTSLLEESEENQ